MASSCNRIYILYIQRITRLTSTLFGIMNTKMYLCIWILIQRNIFKAFENGL